MEIELLIPNKSPIKVTAELTDFGLRLVNDERKITLGLRGELWRLFEMPPAPPPPEREWQRQAEPSPPASSPDEAVRSNNWDWLKPEFVISYFEQSKILNSMAPDVRAALAPLCEANPAEPGGSQLAADLAILRPLRDELINEAGNPRTGAKTRIARELGGSPGGSFFYTRVLPAVAALSSASTDEKSPETTKYKQSAA